MRKVFTSIKIKLKAFKYYKVLRGIIMWPIDLYIWLIKFYKWFLMAFQKNIIIDPATKWRYILWKMCGVRIRGGGKFYVGYDVYFDAQNAKYITIEDGVWISSRCTILCHKRDLSDYHKNSIYSSLNTKIAPVHICKNAAIGMDSMIMPGVTIGEGAVIGSGSLVTKDIPAWSLAYGRPAVVIKKFE